MRYRWHMSLSWLSVTLVAGYVAEHLTLAVDSPASETIENAPVENGNGVPQWIHRGFEQFSKGSFDNGGDNLYVNARGVIEMIHRFDVNHDGYVDLVLPNAHGYIERGPTWLYTQSEKGRHHWSRRELPNDSGWMSRIKDVDGDGHPDLIVVNAENGVTSELNSYVYWGGPKGLSNDRTELPTAGAYDVAAVDLGGNGRIDLVFPSAWVDHHNAGKRRPIQVFEQVSPRELVDVSDRYGLTGFAPLSLVCEDLNSDDKPELVVANYRKEFEHDTESFVYWGTEKGFDADSPLKLPTHYAMQVVLGDLDGNGDKEIVFAGKNRIHIYWNRKGVIGPEDLTVLDAEGNSTMLCQGAVRIKIVDVDQDGRDELLVATSKGIEVRTSDNLREAKQLLAFKQGVWIDAVDLDGDKRPDLIASRYQDGKTYETSSAIFWNDPAGFSNDRVTLLSTTGAMGCTAGDLDGTGRPTVVFNNTMRGPSTSDPDFPLYIYLGSKAGDYRVDRRLELPTGGTNTYVQADLDLDGFAEVVPTVPGGLRIFHGGPTGPSPDNFTKLSNRGQLSFYVLVADFNRDGWLDLLDVAYTYDDKSETMANSSSIFFGSPAGFAAERSTVLPTYCKGNARLADIDNDSWLDVLFYDPRGFISGYLGGPQGFSPDRMWKFPLEVGSDRAVSSINCADLNADGRLDLIVSVMGHYSRQASGFFLLYGGPNGFSQDQFEFHRSEASSILISVADLNRDGKLDLLAPAYSTQFSRELPAHVYWGKDKTFNFAKPFAIPCDSSCAFVALDINGSGYLDLLAICHRNDLGHQVDSLLFWNGPEGLRLNKVSRLPGLGPHLSSPRDFGNSFTREPLESYISPPCDTKGLRPVRLTWKAETPEKTSLKFQLRSADSKEELERAAWEGPEGAKSFYEKPDQEVSLRAPRNWVQYKATLISLNGCHSPKLEEVRLEFLPFRPKDQRLLPQ